MSLDMNTNTNSGSASTNEDFVIIEEIDKLKEIESWDELDIDSSILRGIFSYGYEKPSPIQQKAIIPMLEKRDLIAQAQSGTGKTATFSIGALATVDLTRDETQVLILSPTRELTIQTANVIKKLGYAMDGLVVATYFGGVSSITDGQPTPHIICGCPGRVNEMIRKNKINSCTIKLFILDETDVMLDKDFKEQIYNIFTSMTMDIQVALFSATYPRETFSVINKIMRNPVKIYVKSEELTLKGIMQYYVAMENDNHKYEMLNQIISTVSVSQCIVYCNSVRRVNDLYFEMVRDYKNNYNCPLENVPICLIHSSMDKKVRDEAFTEFRNGKYRIMISTDVTSRGIDIQQVGIVINFDISKDIHNYLHRIGRSGRWGRKGVAINFVTRYDRFIMGAIEKHYNCNIEPLPEKLADI